MTVVIGATNFLIGVGVGLVAMVILFVLNYSRINVVHHALSGAEMRSNVERCAYHRRVLAEELGRRPFTSLLPVCCPSDWPPPPGRLKQC